MADTFYWVRAYTDLAPGDGQRYVGWITQYEGFDRDAAMSAARNAATFSWPTIIDSQIVGKPTWEPRDVYYWPRAEEGAAPPTPMVPSESIGSSVMRTVLVSGGGGAAIGAVAGQFIAKRPREGAVLGMLGGLLVGWAYAKSQ